MKYLGTATSKTTNFFSSVLSAITESISSLLTSIKMFISVGLVILGVVVVAGLLDVLVRYHNYKYGTKYRTRLILQHLLISSIRKALNPRSH